MTLRNQVTKKLTLEGNQACRDCANMIKEIYTYYRDEGYSIEETFYMICSAANMCVHQEAL